MKNLTDIKRRLAPGVELICISNTGFPELDGERRIVLQVQGKGFYVTRPDSKDPDARFWSDFPKSAKSVEIVDTDTFRWPLRRGPLTVTMRFVENQPATHPSSERDHLEKGEGTNKP